MPGDTPCPVCSMQSERQRVAAMARLDTFLRGVPSHSVEDVLRDAFDLYEAAAAAVSDGQTILTRRPGRGRTAAATPENVVAVV